MKIIVNVPAHLVLASLLNKGARVERVDPKSLRGLDYTVVVEVPSSRPSSDPEELEITVGE